MPINHTPIKKEEEKNLKREEKYILTEAKYTFEDIILPEKVKDEIENAIALNKYKKLIFETWGLDAVFKTSRNISINLYGYSGTGKSMTAHAIAAALNKKILMVNFSEIESKYVGETSKNLVDLFKYAEKSDAVILFDEADALLSKRVTMMNSATDVSVNQTRNVLLKILDNYSGVVIFTTNFIQNYDVAFLRRISSHIKFDMPNEEMRKRLWEYYLVPQLPISVEREKIIASLSKVESITGADIATVVLKTAVKAARLSMEITENELKEQMDSVIAIKKMIKDDKFTITTKKVPESFVKEKVLNGGMIGGNI